MPFRNLSFICGAIVASLALLLAACSHSDENSGDEKPTATSAPILAENSQENSGETPTATSVPTPGENPGKDTGEDKGKDTGDIICENPISHLILQINPPSNFPKSPSLKLLTPRATIATAFISTSERSTYFLATRQGVVFRYESDDDDGQNQLCGTQVLDISNRTAALSELGFLGLAISPDNEWLYLSYSDTTGSEPVPPSVIDAILISGLGDGNLDNLKMARIIETSQPAGNHNGGEILFSPVDGYLYVAYGDGGGANDQFGNGQNRNTLLGSILRIDPTPDSPVTVFPVAEPSATEIEPSTQGRYEIPPDNPFVNTNNALPEIWAYGVRNPWRMAFESTTGDLWFGDVGQNKIEEVDVIPNGQGGLNFGWNQYEGSDLFRGPQTIRNHTLPVFEYGHSAAQPSNAKRCSITGGQLYSGNAFPQFRGMYLYADYCASGTIWAYDPVTNRGDIPVIYDSSVGGIIDFGVNEANEIIIGASTGTYILSPEA